MTTGIYSSKCLEGDFRTFPFTQFSELPLRPFIESSLPVSNSQGTAKITHLGDAPL